MEHCQEAERRSQGSCSIFLQPFPQELKDGCSSRLVPRRRSKIPLHQPTRPGFLLHLFTILSASILIPAFHDVLTWLANKGGLRLSISDIGVSAEPCSSSELQEVTVSNDTAFNISEIFSCEGGSFNVSWVGVVIVSDTISIGQGTTVRIFGESEAATSSIPTISGDSFSSIDSSGNITDIELELERLSSDLNLPQGLISAAVGSIGIDGVSDTSVSSGSIFFVDGGVLHLESLAVQRGNSTGNGGAIYAEQSNISVSNCEFEDNFAEQDGGGIYAHLSTLTIWDSVFRANIAGYQSFAGDEDADGEGGGIACDNTALYLEGCLFDDNYASNKGGGVIIEEGQVSIVNSLFFNNLAGSDNVEFEEPFGEGAAISVADCNRSFDGQSSCSVNDTTFIYNTVAKKGGAVSVSSGSTYIEFHRCVVENTTTGWPFEDDPQGEGGAFSLDSGITMVMQDCVVKNNYCGRKGGVFTVSSGDDWANPGGTLIIRNSTFTGNIAKFNSAGVVNLGEFATARFEGQGNNFTGNECGLYGGVLAATLNTNITVEGGLFQGNVADEGGGVFWVKGNLFINGGNFSDNYVSENSGGVVFASEESSVTLSGGYFEGNDALNGGVAFVELDAVMLVEGGVYTDNIAQNGGGVFWGEDGGDLHIIGGVFKDNNADFGGFLYAEASGNTSCEGASVERNIAVNGGAIYAVDGAVVDCACHLIGNEALSGPAIYAREGSNVTIHGINVSDNVVSQGSAMFIVSSTLYTFRVNIVDSTGSFELSAVQSDPDSTYIAEETSFVGFHGETVVYSEGILYLDDCDFSESSASMLVYSGANATVVVRNAVLGDNNFEAVIEEASAASEIPENASLINVVLTCSDPVSPCSAGSPCLEGDLGVYCQCYERRFSSEKVCLNGDPEGLSKENSTAPSTTYYPDLLEGDLVLDFDAVGVCEACLSLTTTSTTATGVLTSNGIVWNSSAISQEPISWTVFPSVGLLRPGNSITLRVVGLPSETLDDTTTATFTVDALGALNQEENSTSNSSSSAEDGGESEYNVLTYDMEVTFYHCEAGSFWNLSDDESTSSCELCSDIEGDDEVTVDVVTEKGLDCSSPGVSTLNLPLNSGYWRASLYTTVIRECFNEDACVGGSVANVDDYCDTGYEGPFCGVCATGYGRGSANTCHKCTEEFKGVMYFVFVVVALLTIIVVVLLGVYLVGGRIAVSQVVSATISSGRKLRCGCFMGSNVAGQNDSGSFSRMDRNRKEITPVKAPASVQDAVSGNGSASAFRPSAAAAGYATSDGNYLTGQKRETARSDDFYITGLESDCKSIEESESSHDLRISRASDSFRGVPGKGLGHESSCTPASAEEKITSRDGRIRTGVNPSTISVRVAAPTPARERESGGSGSREGKEESSDYGKEDKTATVVIGKFLARLPLSKLKIIIVVWQISSAFIEITEVSFPTVYENFLSTIGLFSFDLSWILSATCMTDVLDFYDGLLAVTIGPLFLFGLLGITFHLGLRDLRSMHHGTSAEDTDMTSSGRALSTTIGDMKTLQDDHSSAGATATKSFSRDVGGSMGHQFRNSNATTSDKLSKGGKSRIGMTRRWSVRRVLKEGPGDDPNSEQNHVWGLFARHTTVTLIILYLVYSQVSTTVFQTFVCEDLDEIGKSFLRADFSVECNTPKHEAYKIYAAIMICVYPLGIPAAFCYFLIRQKSRINPSVEESVESARDDEHVLERKVEKRMEDPTVAPTSFLWASYYPDRYYFEVCECIRRLFLTGILVFLAPDTAEQVAYSCLFAFISLFAFELLVPHMDTLDRVLYRTGCLVIFFTNFLALLIKAEVADPDAGGSTAFSIGLIIANISLVVMSVWWNTWATIKAMFSRSHMQGMTIGVDIIGEDKIDSLAAAMKAKGTKGRGDTEDVVKTEEEDVEVTPEWQRDPPVEGEVSNMSSNRTYNQERRQDIVNAYIADSILNPPTLSASQASWSSDDVMDVPESLK